MRYITKLSEHAISSGDLEGLVLTGLTTNGFTLIQNCKSRRTYDIAHFVLTSMQTWIEVEMFKLPLWQLRWYIRPELQVGKHRFVHHVCS